jgi:spore coat protein CotF
MCMKKKRMGEEERIRTKITLSKEVFNMAIDHNINLSQFLENQLLNYFSMKKQVFNIQNTPSTYSTHS